MDVHSTPQTTAGGNGRAHGEVATNIVLRPIGNPLPLGLFAMGAGSFIVASEQLGWLPAGELPAVGWLLFAFAVPLCAIAALFAVFTRDTASGTALGVAAGTLAGFALTFLGGTPLTATGTAAAATVHVFAWFLFASAAAMTLTALTSSLGRPVFAVAILAFAAWSVATAIFQLNGANGWQEVAGIVGLVTAGVAAIAAAMREALEEMIQAEESPNTPRILRGVRRPENGGVSTPIQGLEREPGVRAKL